METSSKRSIIAVIVLALIIVLLVVVFGQSESLQTANNLPPANTAGNTTTVIPVPVLKLSPAELSQKKAEILKRVGDASRPLTDAEKKSIATYVSGESGDRFGFTMEEKLMIVKAINRN